MVLPVIPFDQTICPWQFSAVISILSPAQIKSLTQDIDGLVRLIYRILRTLEATLKQVSPLLQMAL